MFDPSRPASVPLPAASVILVRERRPGADVEVFLVRRHRKSSFMSDNFVFPGGKIDPEDAGAEVAAIRELFEEAGVLLARGELPAERREAWRRRLNAREAGFAALLAGEGLTPDPARLHWWARWITPAVEPRRFDACFFLAELPSGQTPSFDDKETVEELWIAPAEALARQAAGTLRLPPPQIKTLLELGDDAPHGVGRLAARAAERARHPHPIMPRFAQLGAQVALLLPWDPEYETRGVGEAAPLPRGHFLASGPSRFLLEGMAWKLTYAPESLRAG